jgi:hypothetical protein
MSVAYVGAYTWSASYAASSISKSETSIARSCHVSVSNVPCFSCRASSVSKRGDASAANIYGGSLSVMYVGAHTLSESLESRGSSFSSSAATTALDISVSVNNAPCYDCSALTSSTIVSNFGASAYGGSMSVVFFGAHTWSFSQGSNSISTSAATIASDVSVSVLHSPCSNCSALVSSGSYALGASAYGGSMSVVYIGAYTWSHSSEATSNSTSAATSVSDLSVSVSNTSCSYCSVVINSEVETFGASSYGGSMSVAHVGAYTWSYSYRASSSSSSDQTSISGVKVRISSAHCSNCSAFTKTVDESFGVVSIGGSISAVYIGAYVYSFSTGAIGSQSSSDCGSTRVYGLDVSISTSSFRQTRAFNRKH